ncbi:MAG: glycosyltransferase family 2 protein [Ruminococcaceae bacterium]|nr:glycosyltransferase family 2 protein [Oscillospiraceae bacterium]
MEITFSVVVPVYKAELYLPKCIESVLSQSYKNFELILVDDGSPDNCPKICDEYALKDNRIKVIHKENGGASDARNVGIDASNGEFLFFLDSDDYWNTPCVLEKIYEIIQKNSGVHIVQFGQGNLYNKDNRQIYGPKRTLSQYNGSTSKEVIPTLISTDMLSISACSMALSRKFIIDNNIYFKKGLKTEDLEWSIRLYSFEPIWSFCDEYFYVYRLQQENSVTANIDYNHLCDYCWIIENAIKLIEQLHSTLKTALMSYLMYHTLIAIALCYKINIQTAQRKEILYRLKTICKRRIKKYTLNKKVKLAKTFYCLGGFKFMATALGFYLNNRGR